MDIPKLKQLTLHRRNGMIFQGLCQLPWQCVEGLGGGRLGQRIRKIAQPCVGLCGLVKASEDSGICIGGVNDLQHGVHAVVECSKHVVNPINTELITEIEIEVVGFSDGFASKPMFHSAPHEAFVAPTVAVPTTGGKNNAHHGLKPRHTWRDVFVKWLHEPHRMDDLSDGEADGAEDEDDEGEDKTLSIAIILSCFELNRCANNCCSISYVMCMWSLFSVFALVVLNDKLLLSFFDELPIHLE